MLKKILLALTATTMVASPMAVVQAQPVPHRETHQVSPHREVYQTAKQTHHGHAVRQNNHRRWAKGQHFDHRYAANYRVIDNYRSYRLKAPPRGYHWVRSGKDAVLVAITSGIIASVIVGAIH